MICLIRVTFICAVALGFGSWLAFSQPQTSCAACGEERWAIKTLSDTNAGQVDFTPKSGSVAALTNMPAPKDGTTRNPSEMQTYSVQAMLVGYKIESDHDFHIVLQDLNTAATMVVEIPDVTCSGACTSIKKAEIEKVRADFASGLSKAPDVEFFPLAKPVQVEVTGVAFFDFAHGQTGLAPNCIELHPVLSFIFTEKPSSVADRSKEPKKHPESFYHCLPETHE